MMPARRHPMPPRGCPRCSMRLTCGFLRPWRRRSWTARRTRCRVGGGSSMLRALSYASVSSAGYVMPRPQNGHDDGYSEISEPASCCTDDVVGESDLEDSLSEMLEPESDKAKPESRKSVPEAETPVSLSEGEVVGDDEAKMLESFVDVPEGAGESSGDEHVEIEASS
eukprot:Colp12_sorted_trinity150504_noHs@15292